MSFHQMENPLKSDWPHKRPPQLPGGLLEPLFNTTQLLLYSALNSPRTSDSSWKMEVVSLPLLLSIRAEGHLWSPVKWSGAKHSSEDQGVGSYPGRAWHTFTSPNLVQRGWGTKETWSKNCPLQPTETARLLRRNQSYNQAYGKSNMFKETLIVRHAKKR